MEIYSSAEGRDGADLRAADGIWHWRAINAHFLLSSGDSAQSLNLIQDLLNHQVSAAMGSDSRSAEYWFSNSHLSAADKILNPDDIVLMTKFGRWFPRVQIFTASNEKSDIRDHIQDSVVATFYWKKIKPLKAVCDQASHISTLKLNLLVMLNLLAFMSLPPCFVLNESIFALWKTFFFFFFRKIKSLTKHFGAHFCFPS